MRIREAPRGTFFIAEHNGIAVFDRNKQTALERLTVLIWPMPRAPYVEEFVSKARVRPNLKTVSS